MGPACRSIAAYPLEDMVADCGFSGAIATDYCNQRRHCAGLVPHYCTRVNKSVIEMIPACSHIETIRRPQFAYVKARLRSGRRKYEQCNKIVAIQRKPGIWCA